MFNLNPRSTTPQINNIYSNTPNAPVANNKYPNFNFAFALRGTNVGKLFTKNALKELADRKIEQVKIYTPPTTSHPPVTQSGQAYFTKKLNNPDADFLRSVLVGTPPPVKASPSQIPDVTVEDETENFEEDLNARNERAYQDTGKAADDATPMITYLPDWKSGSRELWSEKASTEELDTLIPSPTSTETQDIRDQQTTSAKDGAIELFNAINSGADSDALNDIINRLASETSSLDVEDLKNVFAATLHDANDTTEDTIKSAIRQRQAGDGSDTDINLQKMRTALAPLMYNLAEIAQEKTHGVESHQNVENTQDVLTRNKLSASGPETMDDAQEISASSLHKAGSRANTQPNHIQSTAGQAESPAAPDTKRAETNAKPQDTDKPHPGLIKSSVHTVGSFFGLLLSVVFGWFPLIGGSWGENIKSSWKGLEENIFNIGVSIFGSNPSPKSNNDVN